MNDSAPNITAEIIVIENLSGLPKGTYKVLVADGPQEAVKEYLAKHAGKYGGAAKAIFQLRKMFYFPVDIDVAAA